MSDLTKTKYTAHADQQRDHILEVSEKLFIKKGLNNVSFSEIASACRIMRTTLYKYFKNINRLLWEIQRRNMLIFGEAILERFSSTTTTYQRYKIFFEYLLECYEANPEAFAFSSIFFEQYQQGTIYSKEGEYEQVFHSGDFGSKDTVGILMQNFHDETMRPDLDPLETAVAITYSGMSLLNSYSKAAWSLPLKYQLDAKQQVKNTFDLILRGLRV